MKKKIAIVFAVIFSASVSAKQYVKNIDIKFDSLQSGKNWFENPTIVYADIKELQEIINAGFVIESITPITRKFGYGSYTNRLIIVYRDNRQGD